MVSFARDGWTITSITLREKWIMQTDTSPKLVALNYRPCADAFARGQEPAYPVSGKPGKGRLCA